MFSLPRSYAADVIIETRYIRFTSRRWDDTLSSMWFQLVTIKKLQIHKLFHNFDKFVSDIQLFKCLRLFEFSTDAEPGSRLYPR